jgi:hypothetical protein
LGSDIRKGGAEPYLPNGHIRIMPFVRLLAPPIWRILEHHAATKCDRTVVARAHRSIPRNP